MATYKFPQFNVEISDPVVSIDLNTIGDRALDKLLSVDIFLIVPGARFGVRMENMPYLNTWDDDDIFSMVNIALEAFEV